MNIVSMHQLVAACDDTKVVSGNPASAVHGPKHSTKVGKTPVLTAAETRMLLDSIDTSTLIGLRDRALIGVMVYSFGRISAVIGMSVADYYTQGKRSYLRLHEKGGKFNIVPAHHVVQDYLDAYVKAAGLEKGSHVMHNMTKFLEGYPTL